MRPTAFARAGLAALVLALTSVTAGAARDMQLFDCTRLPAEAVRELPSPVETWTRLDCRFFGQLFVQKPGWMWRYSGTYMQEVMVAAIMGATAEETAGGRYFRNISVTKREGQELADLDRQLKQQLVTYAFIAGEETPRAAYTLRGVTDLLDIITIHFLERKEGDLWAVACTPDCRPENVFLVQKVGG
jgi:hypothetical protein